MDYFNFKKAWQVDKIIPKDLLYQQIKANEKLKKVFVDSVERVRIKYIVNRANSNIETYIKGTDHYEELHFLEIKLRSPEHIERIAKAIHSVLPHTTFIELHYQGLIMISAATKVIDKTIKVNAIYNTKLFIEQDQPEFTRGFDIKNLNSANLKSFYNSILDQVKHFKLFQGTEQVKKVSSITLDELLVLEADLEELKKKMGRENQLNRRVELGNQMKRIKQQIKKLRQ